MQSVTTTETVDCPVCDGTGNSRSATGACRTCDGLKRVILQRPPADPLPIESVSSERMAGSKPPHIARACLLAQRTIGPIEKLAVNPHEGYRYAAADRVIELARAKLLEHGVMPSIDEVVPQEGCRLLLVMQLEHVVSGEVWRRSRSIAVIDDGQGWDKAENAARTVGFSYWLQDVLAIPRAADKGEDIDQRGRAEQGGGRSGASESRGRKAVPNPDDAVRALLGELSSASTQAELVRARRSVSRALKARTVGGRAELDLLQVTDQEAELRVNANEAARAAEGPQGAAA